MVGVASAATARGDRHVAANTRESASAPAASCCRTTHRSSSPSSFGTLRRCIRAGSIWAWAGAPGTDRAPPGRCGAPATGRVSRRTCLEVQAYLGDPQPGQASRRFRGAARRSLDPRLQPLRGAARGEPGPALRLRVAFRPPSSARGDCIIRARFQPSVHQAAPYAMIGVNVVAADTDSRPGGCSPRPQQQFHQPRARHAGASAPAGRRHRGDLGAAREGAGLADAGPVPGGSAERCAGARRAGGRDGGRRDPGGERDPRSGGAAAFLHPPGRGPGFLKPVPTARVA